MDFSCAIYAEGITEQEMIDLLEERTSFIKFKLTINCRNTKPICDEIETITEFQQPPGMLIRIDGPPVHYITFSDLDNQKEKLESVLDSLVKEGIPEKNITILSPVRRENSVVSLIKKYSIRNYTVSQIYYIQYNSGFKELENSVIILTDINILTTKVMYVALSRPRSCLYVLESENAAGEYVKLQMRRLLACSRIEGSK